MQKASSDNPTKQFTGHIRPLREGDIVALRSIWETWVRKDGVVLDDEIEVIERTIRASLNGMNDRTYLVAESVSGEVLGMMGITSPDPRMLTYTQTDHSVELVNAFVTQKQIQSGAGRALVSALEAEAKKRGHTEMVVNSGLRYMYTGGWAFWTKMYGRHVGVAEDYYGPHIVANVWTKRL